MGPVYQLENNLIVPVPLKIGVQQSDDRIKNYIQKSVFKWYKLQAVERIKHKVLQYSEKLECLQKVFL